MNFEQAQRIVAFGRIPPRREDQVKLLEAAGYTQLRRKPLASCGDSQIFTATQRIYHQATEVYRAKQEKLRLDLDQVTRDYARRLYETFNIPESQRNQISPSELEQQLLD